MSSRQYITHTLAHRPFGLLNETLSTTNLTAASTPDDIVLSAKSSESVESSIRRALDYRIGQRSTRHRLNYEWR